MTMTRAMPPKGDDDALLVEGNALTAMALMIALSAPTEKDTMIALVENFLIRHEAKERAHTTHQQVRRHSRPP